MKVKELKKLIKDVNDNVDIEVSCSGWGSAVSHVKAYLDKIDNKDIFIIEID